MRRREFLKLLGAAAAPDLMRRYNVQGVSIAWIRGGALERTEHYGVAGPDTVFQAASISKPVAAMAALHMMQYDNFALDEDVNGKLSSWKVPENEFTRTQKVTLRRLLSHTAGLTVHGFPGYAAGAPLPSLVQVLNGEKPANTAPVRVDTEPGTRYRYSGGGYTVLQQLMMDCMKMPFPAIMQMAVLKPLQMTRSTYAQPLAESWAPNAARAHDAAGKPYEGRWHTYPEMAAAGLWTTPSDLARFLIEVRKAARGESNAVIERPTARAMLTREKDDYGLGLQLRGEGGAMRFRHGGSNAGYRCGMQMNLGSGDGFVIMTNSDRGAELINGLVSAGEPAQAR